MPQFFLHLRRGDEVVRDEEGAYFTTVDAARLEAMKAVREICAEAVKTGAALDIDAVFVEDSEKRLVSVVFVDEALPPQMRMQPRASRHLERLMTALDVSTVEREAKGLHELEPLLTQVLEQIPIAVGLMDGDGRWVVANAAMTRLMSKHIPSRDGDRIYRWHCFDADGRMLDPTHWPGARALRGETVSPGLNFIYVENNGSRKLLRVTATPLRHANGQLVGAIAMVEDIRRPAESGGAERSDSSRNIVDPGAWSGAASRRADLRPN